MSLSELCANVIVKRGENKEFLDKNAMEFLTSPWGLALGCNSDVPPLYPSQRFIIKCYYGLELDNSANRDIRINDQFNEKELYRFNEEEYMQYLFNEGRINRLYYPGQEYPNMVLVIGRRAGKCLESGTLVYTDNGLIEIQDIGDPNGAEYQPLEVMVAQEGNRKSKSAFYYNGGRKTVIRIKTHCGFEEAGTENHRVKVLAEDGTIQWRYLRDIKVNDYIGIHRKADLWAKENVNLEPYKKDLTGKKEVELPTQLNETWATLLGVLVGDGSWNYYNNIDVTVGPYPEWVEQVKNLFVETFGSYSELYPKNRAGKIKFNSTKARQFLNNIGYKLGVKSDTKQIPWVILRSPKNIVAAFLRGLFETDGCFERKRVISFSSASKKLIQEVQLLLLNFGIVSRVRDKLNKKYGKIYYHLNILGYESLELFSRHIGFLSNRKKDLLNDRITKGYLGNKSSIESIPYQKDWCLKLRDSVLNGRYAVNGFGNGERNRTRIANAIGNVTKNCNENMTYPRIIDVIKVAKEVNADLEIVKHFEELQDAGYCWDRVISLKNDVADVYDLNVPEGESFVANGITNHNTTITSCIIAFEVYKLLNKYCPQEYYEIMPEDPIRVTCISTSKDTASELFSKIVGHVERSEFFRKYRRKPTAQYLYLHTQRDLDKYGPKGIASINIRVAPCSAKGLRGPGCIAVALDEMAFFFADEKNTQSNKDRDDRAIYKAATPSVAKFKKRDGTPDGKIICISSPGPKSGKFFEEYERAFEEGNEDLFMMQAPTWEIDPNLSTQFLKNKYKENHINFKSEFGAQFSDRLFGWIDDPEMVRKNIVPGLKCKPRSMIRVPHFMGIDVGLKNDGTAVTIGHWITEWDNNVKVDRLEVDDYQVRFAEKEGKEYFDPEELIDWFATFPAKFYIARALMDQYYGMTIVPQLHKRGLKQFEYRSFSDQLNSDVYQMLLSSFLSKGIRLPEGEVSVINGVKINDSELVQELLTLQAEQKSKYIIKVFAPERKGEHDDLSDSLARMVFIANEYKSKSFTYNLNNNAAGSPIRVARMMKHSERAKASLNRPSSQYLGMMSQRMGGRSFRIG